jgi:hypothetical protein
VRALVPDTSQEEWIRISVCAGGSAVDAALVVLQGLARCADTAFRARLVFGTSSPTDTAVPPYQGIPPGGAP